MENGSLQNKNMRNGGPRFSCCLWNWLLPPPHLTFPFSYSFLSRQNDALTVLAIRGVGVEPIPTTKKLHVKCQNIALIQKYFSIVVYNLHIKIF
jgi:hypothetical protein